MKFPTMGSLVRQKTVLSIAIVGIGCFAAGGYMLMEPTPVKAADETHGVVVRQSAGPLGMVRGQSAQFGLLLPAVQSVRGCSPTVNLRLTTFPGNELVVDKTTKIDGTADWTGALNVVVDEHGTIFVNGERTTKFLHEGTRLNLVAAARITLCDGSVTPNPTASLQIFDTATGDTTSVIGLNFYPTAQRIQ